MQSIQKIFVEKFISAIYLNGYNIVYLDNNKLNYAIYLFDKILQEKYNQYLFFFPIIDKNGNDNFNNLLFTTLYLDYAYIENGSNNSFNLNINKESALNLLNKDDELDITNEMIINIVNVVAPIFCDINEVNKQKIKTNK